MKTLTKKIMLWLFGALLVLCTAASTVSFSAYKANAEVFASATELTMLSGASARKNSATPGLKFTAQIDGFDAGYDYGMIIIPAKWLEIFDFNDDYIAVLNEKVGTGNYAKGECTPYQKDGVYYVSLALTGILPQNYTLDFVGIAFATDGVNYKYASFTEYDNARSIAYVAEMAIKNDAKLTQEEVMTLSTFVNADPERKISSKEYIYYSAETGTYSSGEMSFEGNAELVRDNYALVFNVNSISPDGGKMSYVTAGSFSDITEISFKAKVDTTKTRVYSDDLGYHFEDGEGTVSWWGLNVFDDYSAVNIYSNMLAVPNNTTDNAWATFRYVIENGKCKITQTLANGTVSTITKDFPSLDNYYIGIIGAKGEMSAPILFDDFTIVANGETYTEDFDDKLTDGLFERKDDTSDITTVKIADGKLAIGSAPANSSVTVTGDMIKSDQPSLVSKNTYSNITSIEYDIKYESGFAPDWAGFYMLPSYADIYSFAAYNYYYLDAWVQAGYNYHVTYSVSGTEVAINCVSSDGGRTFNTTKNLTSTANNYLAFFEEAKNNSAGYTIKNFKIVADGTEYSGLTEIFNCGAAVIDESADDSYNFDNLVSGKIAAYLDSGNYASIIGNTIDLTDLPESTLALEGTIKYLIDGEKEFAIVFGGTKTSPDYLFVNGQGVSFYNNTVKSGVTLSAADGENVLKFSVTKGGRLLVKMNDGDYRGLGNVSEVTGLKIVGLGGTGIVSFGLIDSDVYYSTTEGGVTRTYDYAEFDGATDVYENLYINGAGVTKTSNDFAMRVDPTANAQEGVAFATSRAYENIEKITFDMKAPETISATDPWVAFMLNTTVGGCYDWTEGKGFELYGADAIEKGVWYSFEITVNGTSATAQWGKKGEAFSKNKTFTVASASLYFYFAFNVGGAYNATDIYSFDNFVITAGGTDYTDDFNGETSNLLTVKKGEFGFDKISSPALIINGSEGKTNYAMGIVSASVKGDEKIPAITKKSYSNVSSVTFKAKFDNTVATTDRWGLGITETKDNYNCYASTAELAMDNEWHTYSFTFTESNVQIAKDGASFGTNNNYNNAGTYYFYFQLCPSGGLNNEGIALMVDDFTVTYGGGTVEKDDFTSGVDTTFDKANGQRELLQTEYTSNDSDITEKLDGGNVGGLINELGKYIYGRDFVTEGLGDNQNVLFGSISYEINGDKTFVIVLGENAAANSADFLLVNSSSIAFYKVNGGESVLVKSITSSNSVSLSIYLTKIGKLVVNNGGANEVMGTVDNVNRLKIADLCGSGSVSFDNISLKTREYRTYEEIDGIKVPYYSSESGINFTAYASPTVAKWSNGTSPDNPDLLNAVQYKLMQEAGFNKAIALYEGRSAHKTAFIEKWNAYKSGSATIEEVKAVAALVNADCEEDAVKGLSVAERYGLKYYVLHNLFFEMITQADFDKSDYSTLVEIFFEGNEYTKSGAYAGNFLQDEPSATDTSDLEKVKAAAEAFLALYPEAEPLVNLLPGGAANAKYTAYLDYYFDNLAGLLGYVSFDDYALDKTNGNYSINTYHLSNLMQIASRVKAYNDANETDIELRTFVYALTKADDAGNRAIDSINDLRFQIYSNLCFGATEIAYYCYAPATGDSSEEQSGLIDFYTGETTKAYEWAKSVNNEVHAFEKAYVNFKWKGVMTYDYKKYVWSASNKQFAQIKDTKLSSYAGVSSLTGTTDCLMGVFEDDAGNDAYVIMNYGDPKTAGSGNITVKFNDATHVLVYRNGARSLMKLSGGAVTLNLNAGEGVFAIPFNA